MTLANRYDTAATTAMLIAEGMDEYEFEREDYESAALYHENMDEPTREDIGFDLTDPYQRANYDNYKTFSELERVSWFMGDAVHENDDHTECWWGYDVYGVPVHEHGELIGAKVYQDQGMGFPSYIGFTPCTEDTFEQEVKCRSGILYEYFS